MVCGFLRNLKAVGKRRASGCANILLMNRFVQLVHTNAVALRRFDHPSGVVQQDPEWEQAKGHSVNFVEKGSFRMRTTRTLACDRERFAVRDDAGPGVLLFARGGSSVRLLFLGLVRRRDGGERAIVGEADRFASAPAHEPPRVPRAVSAIVRSGR